MGDPRAWLHCAPHPFLDGERAIHAPGGVAAPLPVLNVPSYAPVRFSQCERAIHAPGGVAPALPVLTHRKCAAVRFSPRLAIRAACPFAISRCGVFIVINRLCPCPCP